MVESGFKCLKYVFLFPRRFPNIEALINALPAIIDEYNSKPLKVLKARTPNEALVGVPIPDLEFDPKKVMKRRILENKMYSCGAC